MVGVCVCVCFLLLLIFLAMCQIHSVPVIRSAATICTAAVVETSFIACRGNGNFPSIECSWENVTSLTQKGRRLHFVQQMSSVLGGARGLCRYWRWVAPLELEIQSLGVSAQPRKS